MNRRETYANTLPFAFRDTKPNPTAYEPYDNKEGDRTAWVCSQFLSYMSIVAPPLSTAALTSPTVRPMEITYVPVCES